MHLSNDMKVIRVAEARAPRGSEVNCLPNLGDLEPAAYRWTWLGMLTIVLALYSITLATFWAPADAGVDQNAYLVGGRQFAATLSTKYAPASPFQYVGHMFVTNENHEYYPKYPIGLPVLFASMFWIFGASGATMAYVISPAGAVLAVAGTFFLARALAGSFAAILAAILFATCQVTLELANNPNSHASCVAFVVWGMFLLVRWWQTGSIWRGLLAGFFLGYACLIRYTEGLLVIPMAVAAICAVRWMSWRSYLRAAVPAFGWLAPVGAMLLYNKMTLGDWTGYDSTNESEFGKAFTLEKFRQTWELTLRVFYDQGLFFVLPFGLAGLGMLFRRSWRLGLLMLAWLLPGTALYTSYYWSPDRGMAFARFFLTFFPAILVGFAICVRYGILAGANREIGGRSVALPIAAGIVVAIAAGVSAWRSLGNGAEEMRGPGPGGGGGMSASIAQQHYSRLMLAQSGQIVRQHVPEGSILFSEDARGPEGMLNYLQFAGDWQMFSVSAFSTQGNRMMRGGPMMQDQNMPSPMQPRRREYLADLYRNKTSRDLAAEEGKLIDDALRKGKRVFVVGSTSAGNNFRQNLPSPQKYDLVTVDRWKDAPAPRDERENVVRGNQPFMRRGMGMAGRGGGPGFGPPGGGFGPGNNNMGSEAMMPSSWELTEVRVKSAIPSTRPSDPPIAQG